MQPACFLHGFQGFIASSLWIIILKTFEIPRQEQPFNKEVSDYLSRHDFEKCVHCQNCDVLSDEIPEYEIIAAIDT